MYFFNKAMKYLVIIVMSFYLVNGNFYKVMKFPKVVPYSQVSNILSKVHCASICAMKSWECKAYYYNLSEEQCRLVDFEVGTSISSTQELLSGFVDVGT